MAVLFLDPQHSVGDVWFLAMEENDAVPPETTRFTEYVIGTWMNRQMDNWKHFDNGGLMTTNHVDSWNSKLNKKCRSAHSNI